MGQVPWKTICPQIHLKMYLPDKPAVSHGQTPGLMEAKTKQPEHPIPRSQMAKYTAVHHGKGSGAATTGCVGDRETTFVIEASQEDM